MYSVNSRKEDIIQAAGALQSIETGASRRNQDSEGQNLSLGISPAQACLPLKES